MILAVWRLWCLAMWAAVAAAACTIIVAGALILIVGAIAMGLAMPSRTPGDQLRRLHANAQEAVALIRALDPHAR